MKRNILILLTFLVFCSYSQTTNTSKWRKTERDSFQNAFLLFEEKNYKLALPIYENVLKNHPNEDFVKYVYGKCCLYRSDKYEDALTYLTELYTKNPKIDNILFDLAKANHFNYKFDEALDYVDKFLIAKKTKPEDKPAAELLKKHILNAKVLNANKGTSTIKNIEGPINTGDEEYVPVISADESMMVYTYVGSKSKGGKVNAFLQPDPQGIYTEDIYMSFKKDDKWQEPIALDSANTVGNDAAISLSQDGQVLFVYRDKGDDHGDIYQSFLIGETFTNPVKIKGQVNSYSWDGHCSLSPDGKTLYFSSERGGGYGGKDIYKATLQADSTWGNVVNLGDSINTSYDEDSPFIHPDGSSLFYSSNGPKSSGGYDIFRAVMESDSTFKKTENLGYPINTPDDDIYFVLAANGTHGYYSSGKRGGKGLKDIYLVETNFPYKKPVVVLVKGKVTLDGKPVEANIKIDISSKSKEFSKIKTNSSSGSYLATAPAGQTYKLTFTYQNFAPQVFDVDASQITEYTEKIIDVKFTVIKDTTPVVKVDSASVKPKNEDELDFNASLLQKKIAKYAAKYGNIKAEGLEFKVQVAAYKFPKNYSYEHLKGLGNIDKLPLDDGITRITIGGSFQTLGAAWNHNKKVIKAGQTDAFVTAIYKGKRVYLEELEKLGIFK